MRDLIKRDFLKLATEENMKLKKNKYIYGWKLYVNYGQGWEYETFEETLEAFKTNKRLYQENCPYPQRWCRGRELNN